ncbi:capping protein, Arp2/3 and myosin-I linker protein 2 isoform X2 [Amia ocellicauda]|uniref:capping protein, Arp2/3 and myosin-I linker protein 2 isoform X2 n=1 Tax=Amia ocellicauda TaxID=2972642 RepID=UPI0034647655
MATNSNAEIPYCLQDSIAKFLRPQKIQFMKRVHLNDSRTKADERILVMTLWRGYVFHSRQPIKVESSFSYLEIYAINIASLNQAVIETDRQRYTLSLMSLGDLELVVSHVTASLKKIFPDSSPGKLLKKTPTELHERFKRLTTAVEERMNGSQRPCGGFSETYAALCDFNEFPCREEIQWDVDNIYHIQNCREFNLLDFSHLDSRDVALAVAALSFNQWFTRIYSKDFRLSPEVLEQVLYMINRSPKLEEVCLESSGLKSDFAVKMAGALRDHSCSALHTVNLSNNQIEDKGVVALSQQLEQLPSGLTQLSLSRVSLSPKGVGSLSQAFLVNQSFSSSLRHLDLSGNPGILATEEATQLFNFLSCVNALSHMDLSGTDCPLDTLFVSLSAGCCSKLAYLNLSRNIFSHRKVKEITRSVKDFFSNCAVLGYVGLSATKLPAEALRLLLQGLATNTRLSGLELDLSNCELRSAGAQVIQEHIFEAKAIGSLNLSDNGFDSDMVTLVLSIGRSHTIRRLALGKNFAMKSRALADVLQRIVQLIQEEECPLESLSVADSKLKTGTTVLINALGNNTSLTTIDISGNCIGDTGAKMLAKALQINTKLRTLIWDKNNVTASGFLDVANALEKNYNLQCMAIPMSDVAQAYRSSPERTEEALQKIQACLLRNSQRQAFVSDQAFRLKQGLITSTSEQLVQRLCLKVQDTVRPLTTCSVHEVQNDILCAEEVLRDAKASVGLLPTLYELGRAPSSADTLHDLLSNTAKAITEEITEEIQDLVQSMLSAAQSVCPRVTQRPSVREQLATCVSRKSRQATSFVQETLMQQAGTHIKNKLSELKLSISVSLAESIIDEILQDLSTSQQKLDQHVSEHTSPPPSTSDKAAPRTNIPQLRVVEMEFPTDEYVPVIWRNSIHSRSIRPAPSVKSLLDVEVESQQEDGEAGGGQRTLSISGAALRPGPSHSEDAAALSNNLPVRSEPASPQPPMDLPIEGQRLKHYTRARPRPNRKNKQPPSKPQVQANESENEGIETMGKVDEGVEEFFTKKILPDDPTRSQPPVKAQPVEPTCSAPTSGSKTIKKKFGDFFAFKKVRSARGAKGEGGPEGSPSAGGLRLKKTSIADLIRPLREAAKAAEREKERAEDGAAKGGPATAPTPAPPAHTPAGPPPSAIDREKSRTLDNDREKSRTPDAERKLKPSRRSLREGKSQSLILLPGVDPEEPLPTAHGKHASEGPSSSFEHRVHVMLHRIGVTKVPPYDSKKSQSKEGELRKADSEGTIMDSKPEPPPHFMKPRTMSTSSDMRRPLRPGLAVESLRAAGESSDRPSPERPSPATPRLLMRPPIPAPGESGSEGPRTSPGAASQHSASPTEPQTPSPRCFREIPTPSPRRGASLGEQLDRMERPLHAAPEDSVPRPRPRLKPSPQRRAVSVHEEQLRELSTRLEPEELRATLPRLQRSPVGKRAKRIELEPCTEDQPEGEDGDRQSEETDSRPATEKRSGPRPHMEGHREEQLEPLPAQRAPSDQRTEPPSH